MERALLEGEHQNELDKLGQDQKKISVLKQQQLQLIEQAASKREKVLVDECSRVDTWGSSGSGIFASQGLLSTSVQLADKPVETWIFQLLC